MKGLVLAGGKGGRMGREKGGIVHSDGRTLVRRAVDLLKAVGCGVVVISIREGQEFTEEIAGTNLIRDKGEGPLGGMIAGMETDITTDWLVVACDLPGLDVATLRGLLGYDASFVVYRSEAGCELEPLCGFYGKGAVEILRVAKERGQWGLQDILRDNRAKVLNLENKGALKNANRPCDLEMSEE